MTFFLCYIKTSFFKSSQNVLFLKKLRIFINMIRNGKHVFFHEVHWPIGYEMGFIVGTKWFLSWVRNGNFGFKMAEVPSGQGTK